MEKYSQFRDKGAPSFIHAYPDHTYELTAVCRYGHSALPPRSSASGQHRLAANLRLPVPLPHTIPHLAFGPVLRYRRVVTCWWHNQVPSVMGAFGCDRSVVG
jgi:hypothetical protein